MVEQSTPKVPRSALQDFLRTFVGLVLFWLPFYRLCGFAFYPLFGWSRPTWGHDIFMGVFMAVFLAGWRNRGREMWPEATHPGDSEGADRRSFNNPKPNSLL
jgi:hypothetical protein